MTSWRLAEQVRCDVGGPNCAVAAVAARVRTRADSGVLIIDSSSAFELNVASAIRADAFLDLAVDPPVLPFRLPGGSRVVAREIVLCGGHRVPLERLLRRDRDFAV